MKFVKMQAQGNDFIILDKPELPYHLDITPYITKMCNRHFGIGADGLVVITYPNSYDAEMRIFNADGSEAEMCGSALRCVTWLLAQKLKKSHLKIKTKAGIKKCHFMTDENIKVTLGKAKLLRKNPILLYGQKGYSISMGNPHFVIFADDTSLIEDLGEKISTNSIFKNGVNVEFVKIISRKEVQVEVWERGVGKTLACGTGASAIQFAGKNAGVLDDKLLLHFPGGDLKTKIEDDYISLIGRTEKIFSGEYYK